jgi:hypothetical protein
MNNNGQVERWCSFCKTYTDQQFTILDETNTNLEILYDCLVCWRFEEIMNEPK